MTQESLRHFIDMGEVHARQLANVYAFARDNYGLLHEHTRTAMANIERNNRAILEAQGELK